MPVEGEHESSPTVHQQTTDIIREWLTTKFEDVTGGDSQTLFFFNARFGDRRERLELKVSRDFLANPRNIQRLPAYLQDEILPILLANPGKQIDVGPHGEITVL